LYCVSGFDNWSDWLRLAHDERLPAPSDWYWTGKGGSEERLTTTAGWTVSAVTDDVLTSWLLSADCAAGARKNAAASVVWGCGCLGDGGMVLHGESGSSLGETTWLARTLYSLTTEL